MNILQINSSLFGAQGQSTRLADEFVAALGGTVTVRDLSRDPVPHLDAARFAAFTAKPEARTPEQLAAVRESDRLIAELRAADVLVIGLPMYNFGVPSTLRAYFDHVARAGVTFKYTAQGALGLLGGKKAYVLVTRGGVYGAEHPQATYVRDFLAFLGIEDVTFVYAEGLATGEQARRESLAAARMAMAELNVPEPALI